MKPLRVPLVFYRHRGLRPEDAFLIAYPKSGTTWLQFMLAELTAKEIDFDSDETIFPPVGRHRSVAPVLGTGGRLLRSHEPYRAWYGRKYGAVIYLIRDGRDVAVSNYYHHLRRGWYGGEFSKFLRLFLAGAIDGYGSWQDHVLSWLERQREAPDRVLIMKYEALLHDSVGRLGDISEFLHLGSGPERIARVVENNSIERMREKEMRSKHLAAQRRKNIPFVRRGIAGGWRELFDDEDEEKFVAIAGHALREAGYVLTQKSEPHAELDAGGVARGGSAG